MKRDFETAEREAVRNSIFWEQRYVTLRHYKQPQQSTPILFTI